MLPWLAPSPPPNPGPAGPVSAVAAAAAAEAAAVEAVEGAAAPVSAVAPGCVAEGTAGEVSGLASEGIDGVPGCVGFAAMFGDGVGGVLPPKSGVDPGGELSVLSGAWSDGGGTMISFSDRRCLRNPKRLVGSDAVELPAVHS